MKHFIFEKELKHNVKKTVSIKLVEEQYLDGKFYYLIEQIHKTTFKGETIRINKHKDYYRSKYYEGMIVLHTFEDLCALYLNQKYKKIYSYE